MDQFVFRAVMVLAAVALAGCQAPAPGGRGAGPTAEPTEQTIVVDRETTMAQAGLKTTEWGDIKRLVNQTLAGRPAGWKARVALREHYSNHADHNGMNAYPCAIVALTPEGRPDGEELRFEAEGITRKVPWQNGVREGLETTWQGAVCRSATPWQHDKINGVRKTFFPNGKLQSETTYVNGLPDGPARACEADGLLSREWTMKQGKRHGTATEYWPRSQTPKRVVQYQSGQTAGIAREFYATGKLKSEVTYRDNQKHGPERQYEADGKLVRERWWWHDQAVTHEEYTKAGGR